MRKLIIIVSIISTFFPGLHSQAQSSMEELTAFRQVKQIGMIQVPVPTLVEMPLEVSSDERSLYALYDTTLSQFVPFVVDQSYEQYPVPIQAYSGTAYDNNLVDGKDNTGVDYYATDGVQSTVVITLTAPKPVRSSSIILDLDQYVALPETIQISAVSDGRDRLIVSRIPLSDFRIFFPETLADKWVITLTYIQPLRINEVRLAQNDVNETVRRSIRFLAQPGASYMLYHDADRNVSVQTGESGNLYDDRDIKLIPTPTSSMNVLYQEADTDNDGIPDLRDNCVRQSNPLQEDIDNNGRGDVCDDFDRDGVIQVDDNCPNDPNRNQEDADADGIGDSCDSEESRFTEKYRWIPWAGMGIAGGVIILLFILVATTSRRKNEPTIQ